MKALFKPVSAALLASFLAACSLIPPAQQSSQRQRQRKQQLEQRLEQQQQQQQQCQRGGECVDSAVTRFVCVCVFIVSPQSWRAAADSNS